MKLAVLFCIIALAFSTEVQRKKKKNGVKAWPDKSWQVDKNTGVVTMTLQKSDKAPEMQQKNEWYASTNSKEYGVESWASLEANGQHYLVGSKNAKQGSELPTENDELVVFKMQEDKDMERGDGEGVVVYLKPMTPHGPQNLERKEMLGPFDPFFYTFAAGAAALAFTWPMWAAAAVLATGDARSLEADHGSHAKLKNLLHALEDDVHQLARMDDKSLEKKEAIIPGCMGVFPLGVWCSYWLYPFGMFDQ